MRQLVQLTDTASAAPTVTFRLNGEEVHVPAVGTLLDAVRGELGHLEVKDGCAPQGQCGCCTVLIDGQARVSCVTPVVRAEGRDVATLDGIDPATLDRLLAAFDASAASQCGFCTPGILVRLASLARKGAPVDEASVRSALAAHLCRCTGFQPIVEAGVAALTGAPIGPARDARAATRRATLESSSAQLAGPDIARGAAPFADDTAPRGAAVAIGAGATGYVVAAGEHEARAGISERPGRNSTVPLWHPVAMPEGRFALSLQTTWVEPAYLEPDASWCEPGAAPASPLGNAGAFGAKQRTPVALDAARLATERGGPVRARWTREAVVLRGAKRPPVAIGVREDGTGSVRLGWTEGSAGLEAVCASIREAAPGMDVEVAAVTGPLVGDTHRGAGVAEVLAALAVLRAGNDGTCEVRLGGAVAAVRVRGEGIDAHVEAGEPLCEATMRSFVIGAVHQGYSMVTTEGIALGASGAPVDLTIRSFGITPARAFPHVAVTITGSNAPSVAAGTAVFAATLAAVWLAEGSGPRWPTRR